MKSFKSILEFNRFVSLRPNNQAFPESLSQYQTYDTKNFLFHEIFQVLLSYLQKIISFLIAFRFDKAIAEYTIFFFFIFWTALPLLPLLNILRVPAEIFLLPPFFP